MIIIFGWRPVKRILGTGSFYCPACQGDTAYRHIRSRRWFHIIFVPIIPLSRRGRYVECTRCGGGFVEAALSTPTTAVFEYQLGLANRAMVAHLASLATRLDDGVESAALEALSSAAGVPADYDRRSLHIDLRAFAARETAVRYLQPLADHLTAEGREELRGRATRLVERLPHRTESMTAAVDDFAEALSVTRALGALTPDGDR